MIKPYIINLNKYRYSEEDVIFQFKIKNIAFGLCKYQMVMIK